MTAAMKGTLGRFLSILFFLALILNRYIILNACNPASPLPKWACSLVSP